MKRFFLATAASSREVALVSLQKEDNLSLERKPGKIPERNRRGFFHRRKPARNIPPDHRRNPGETVDERTEEKKKVKTGFNCSFPRFRRGLPPRTAMNDEPLRPLGPPNGRRPESRTRKTPGHPQPFRSQLRTGEESERRPSRFEMAKTPQSPLVGASRSLEPRSACVPEAEDLYREIRARPGHEGRPPCRL